MGPPGLPGKAVPIHFHCDQPLHRGVTRELSPGHEDPDLRRISANPLSPTTPPPAAGLDPAGPQFSRAGATAEGAMAGDLQGLGGDRAGRKDGELGGDKSSNLKKLRPWIEDTDEAVWMPRGQHWQENRRDKHVVVLLQG